MKKCVYGLGDASSNWYLSIAEKLEELKIKCYKSDPALFVYPENNKLQGIICAHVDEGDKLFNEQIRNVKKNYYWNREWNKICISWIEHSTVPELQYLNWSDIIY